MYLAWKEIKHSKGKFSLIIAVIFLVSYLTYFLTSLAYGLASSYTNGINKWGADNIVLNDDANDNIMMSMMKESDYQNINAIDENKAKLGLFPAVVKDYSGENKNKIETYVFGIDEESFIAPKEFKNINLGANQVVASDKLIDEGYSVGDMLTISGTTIVYEIVAFTDLATYQTAPILYTNLSTWREYRFSSSTVELFSAVIIKGEATISSDTLKLMNINDFIFTLPGYNAQVLTFSIMIGFLIIIASFVLAIFIYVLTIQKTSMFGVMKAQGISSGYIGLSVISQTIILTFIGLFFGIGLTLLSGYFLSQTVPFAVNIVFYLAITGAFFLFSILGGLFSVVAVTKIDPLKAIG